MGPGAMLINHLYCARKLADMAAGLGFVSPSMLGIAARIEDVGFQRQADCRL